jgi:serine/threonine protein phosphatase PrpC
MNASADANIIVTEEGPSSAAVVLFPEWKPPFVRLTAGEAAGRATVILSGLARTIARVAWWTSRGFIRDENQDAVLFAPAPVERGAMLGIFDGLGGPSGGKGASAAAAQSFVEQLQRTAPLSIQSFDEQGRKSAGAFLGPRAEMWLRGAMQRANAAVRARAEHDRTEGKTTATVGIASDNILVVAHVGDSRAYLFRSGELRQITRDHSMVEALAEGYMKRDGMSREAALAKARTSGREHEILECLGAEGMPHIDTVMTELLPGDVLLFCTDGLHGVVPDERIAACLASTASPAEIARSLLEDAYAYATADNVTMLVAKIGLLEGGGKS